MTTQNSLGHIVITNYIGQVYVAIIGIVMIPIYIHYMGVEAYGVIGFLTTLQVWMSLLDFGLAPTLGREAARYKAGIIQARKLHQFITLLERFFFSTGVVLLIISSLTGNWIAVNWLKLESVDIGQVATCIPVAGLMISVRLSAAGYRSALQGMELQVKANILTIIFTTIRSVFVVGVFVCLSSSIFVFLIFQLAISAVEMMYLRRALVLSLPAKESGVPSSGLTSIPFVFLRGMAFLYLMGVTFSQIDKLILSHILNIREYAQFMLAATLAMGINLIATPLQQALLPRMTILAELDKLDQLICLYRQTTRFMLAGLAGIVSVFIAFPAQVLFVWTGDELLSTQSAEVLRWYAAGTALMSLTGMPYLLQQAYGKLDLHIKASVISLLIFVPVIIISTSHYGGAGAAKTWMCLNFFSLLIFSPIVHSRFAKGIATKWLIRDILPILLLVATVFLLANTLTWNLAERLNSGAILVFIGLTISGITLGIFKDTRLMSLKMIRKIIRN